MPARYRGDPGGVAGRIRPNCGVYCGFYAGMPGVIPGVARQIRPIKAINSGFDRDRDRG